MQQRISQIWQGVNQWILAKMAILNPKIWKLKMFIYHVHVPNNDA